MSRRGFTSVELSAVLVVLLVLMALLPPVYRRSFGQVKWMSCPSNFKQLAVAASMHATDCDNRVAFGDGQVKAMDLSTGCSGSADRCEGWTSCSGAGANGS